LLVQARDSDDLDVTNAVRNDNDVQGNGVSVAMTRCRHDLVRGFSRNRDGPCGAHHSVHEKVRGNFLHEAGGRWGELTGRNELR
jgi:hypothetical protein